MDKLKDRLDHELNEVPVTPRLASDLIASAGRRRTVRRVATVGVASLVALGSIALISRAFDGSTGGPGGEPSREERIVFNTLSSPNAPGQLYSVRPDGTGLERITEPDADYLSPAVSPDGSRIAFVRFDEGSDPPRTMHEGIFVMNVDGSGMQELLTTGDPKPISVGQVAWSPEGSEIAFVRNFYVDGSEADFRYELWIMGADGSDARRLVDRRIVSFSWSPDGSQIAFTEESVAGMRLLWDIYVMDADGSNGHRLTDDGHSRFPAWSPDGSSIAFQRWIRAGVTHLFLMDPSASGTDPRPLWTGEAGVDSIAWSPDSSTVAFDAYDQREERCSIMTVTAEGEVATILGSQRPELMPGGEVEPSLCAGTLAWASLQGGGASPSGHDMPAEDDDQPTAESIMEDGGPVGRELADALGLELQSGFHGDCSFYVEINDSHEGYCLEGLAGDNNAKQWVIGEALRGRIVTSAELAKVEETLAEVGSLPKEPG